MAFSLYSESLLLRIHECQAAPYALEFDAASRRWLSLLDRQPAPLIAHLAKRTSTRLGLYFESLWCFYWQHINQGRLLLHNHQLTRNGKTLGALDFVIETKNGELVHIEAAAKFFLGNPKTDNNTPSEVVASSAWHSQTLDWIGPNANDRLAWKLDHMRRHQLPLCSSPESRAVIAQAYGQEAPISSQFLLRGCLFWPGASDVSGAISGSSSSLSDDINRNANTGCWWHLADFLQLEILEGCEHFTVLPRNHWLAPACYPSALTPLGLTSIKQAVTRQIGLRQQGVMIVGLQHNDNQWYETHRLFIVPDQWPGTALPSRNT